MIVCVRSCNERIEGNFDISSENRIDARQTDDSKYFHCQRS